MTTLCEDCFQEWAAQEIHSTVPMTPCEQCGRYDDRNNGGLRSHLFPRDPRTQKTWPTNPLFLGKPGKYNGIPEEVVEEFANEARRILGRSLLVNMKTHNV